MTENPVGMQGSAQRLLRRIQELSAFTSSDLPYTRRCFSPMYQSAREYLRKEFESAGLDVALDAAGNMIGRLEGENPGLPAIALGSHIDTVEAGGRFDGILGVVSALEAAQTVVESGERLEHTLEIVDFVGEEPNDYGSSCVGSRAVAGTLSQEMLAATNVDGERLSEAMERNGARVAELRGPIRKPEDFTAFIELHIEQGRILEDNNYPIGIVTGIVAIERYKISMVGRADHAGTTPMHARSDALVAAARFTDGVYRRAQQFAEHSAFVATVGRIAVQPNAPNVVPSAVELVLETRAADESVIARFCDQVFDEASAEGRRLEVAFSFERMSRVTAVPTDPKLQAAIGRASENLGVDSTMLSSGAGHDAMHMAALCPVGMIFVPCHKGISHHPDEWVDTQFIEIGAAVLLETVRVIDGQLC